MRITALLLGAALALGGCGTTERAAVDERALSRAFGGLSQADVDRLKAFFSDLRTYPQDNARLLEELDGARRAAHARRYVRGMRGAVTAARARIEAAESPQLRRELDAYLDALDRATKAYDAAVEYEATAGPPDKAREAALRRETRAAAAAAEAADRRLMARIASGMDPEQRRDFEAQLGR